MRVKSRTIEKVRYIVLLLGAGYSYKWAEKGGYSISYNGIECRIPTTFIWRNTPSECVNTIKENLFGLSRQEFINRCNIGHLEGKEYAKALRIANENYMKMLIELSPDAKLPAFPEFNPEWMKGFSDVPVLI